MYRCSVWIFADGESRDGVSEYFVTDTANGHESEINEEIMKTGMAILLCVLGLSALVGCRDEGTGIDERWLVVPAGAYAYSAFDGDGRAIVKGWLTMEFSDTGTVSGRWHFDALSDRQDIGHQAGDGQLRGALVDTILYVDLNPGWIDNNVILYGTMDDGTYRGRWDWVTFAGVTSHGKFEAVRR